MRCPNETLKAVLRGEWQLLSIETQIAWHDAAAKHLLDYLHRLSLTRHGDALNQQELQDRVLYPEQINGMKAWIQQAFTKEIGGMTELEKILENDYMCSVNMIEHSDIALEQGRVDATCKG